MLQGKICFCFMKHYKIFLILSFSFIMIYPMIIYIILLLILVAWLFLVIYWLPLKRLKWQAENFRKQGYRVLEVPFHPFKMSTLNFYGYKNDTQDSLWKIKKTYPDYDAVVMNIYRSTFVDLLHP